MIWFGKLAGSPPTPLLRFAPPRGGRPGDAHTRMQRALEYVAAHSPHLTGDARVRALTETGLVDAPTATRLLPYFRHFDPDRHFADHLRRISFRGPSMADEFRAGMLRVIEDLTGGADIGAVGPEAAIRFRHGEREGILLAHPEVSFSIGGGTRDAVAAAIEEMPDALVIVARNFGQTTAPQLAGMLSRTGVPGTLVTVNLLLGIRAITLRYQPATERILDLLGTGRPLRRADVATLGTRP